MGALIRLASRVERLEERQAGKQRQRWWWELPDGQWHLGTVGLNHEEALDLLDAEPDADGGDGGRAP